MEGKPLVTIIVPSYNHRKFIKECLDSIKNQTYNNIQWIVVDDGSKDGTPELLKENQSFYGYELYLQLNKGLSATLTDMIKNHANGKYIILCASDDVCMPDRVEKQVVFMESHPQYAMCYARCIRIDQDSNVIGKDTFPGYKSGCIFEDIYLRRFNPGICVAMKTDVLAEIGYYDSGILAEDYYMNCRIAEKYEIGFIDAYLLKYRVAPLGNKRDPWKLVESHKQTVELFSNRPEYKNALQNWELRSGALLAPFKKYKLKALCYFFKNLFTTREKRNFLYLYDIAKGLCTKMWDVNVK